MMIHVNELKTFLGCDDQFLAHLLRTFMKESGEGIDRLKTATESRNWPLVKATAHKMLSSTRILNIEALNGLLEKIEDAAGNGTDVGSIPDEVNTVETIWKNILEEINALLPTLKG